MSIQLVLNISIAFLWMLLNDQWSSMNFLSGYIIGLALIFIMRRFFPTPFYLKKLLAMVKLLLVFLEELILSSIFVIQKVINPKMDFAPGIFSLETHMEGDWEITALAMLITLTPGSVAMEVSPDGKILYVHAIDIPDAKRTVIKSINAFEKAIMEVTRDA
ncbi:MAG: Na+/H+ antiporter subunit E [Pelotomaculaceae bacterium]|nr:Na+/H+ antiporter subunit E [Bacillota bacterium]HHU85880.1 Na+/H+ antiporter subunit E [Peptococcaceae bacterium]